MRTENSVPAVFVLKYLKNRKHELSLFDSDIPDKSVTDLLDLARKIRENAATFGVSELGDLAAEIENSADRQPKSLQLDSKKVLETITWKLKVTIDQLITKFEN